MSRSLRVVLFLLLAVFFLFSCGGASNLGNENSKATGETPVGRGGRLAGADAHDAVELPLGRTVRGFCERDVYYHVYVESYEDLIVTLKILTPGEDLDLTVYGQDDGEPAVVSDSYGDATEYAAVITRSDYDFIVQISPYEGAKAQYELTANLASDLPVAVGRGDEGKTPLNPIALTPGESFSASTDEPMYFSVFTPGAGNLSARLEILGGDVDLDLRAAAYDGFPEEISENYGDEPEHLIVSTAYDNWFLITVYPYGAGEAEFRLTVNTDESLAGTAPSGGEAIPTIALGEEITGYCPDGEERYYQVYVEEYDDLIVALSGLRTEADLDLEVSAQDGDPRRVSERPAGEEESVRIRTAEDYWYLIRVYSYEGGSSYRLATRLAEPENIVPTETAQAVSLGESVRGRITPGREDWYKVFVDGYGDLNAVLAGPAGVDLDLIIYNGQGIELGRSENPESSESVSVDTTRDYWFYIRVFGYDGAQEGRYALTLNFEGGDMTDALGIAPTVIRPGRSVSGAVDHAGARNAWYSFTPDEDYTAEFLLSGASGAADLDLALYTRAGDRLSVSEAWDTSEESIRWAVAPGEEYIIRVYAYNEGDADRFTLQFNRTTGPADREASDLPHGATLLYLDQTVNARFRRGATTEAFRVYVEGYGDLKLLLESQTPAAVSVYGEDGSLLAHHAPAVRPRLSIDTSRFYWYYIIVESESPSPRGFTLTPGFQPRRSEETQEAPLLALGGSVQGSVNYSSAREQIYRIELEEPGRLALNLEGRGGDMDLQLRDEFNNELIRSEEPEAREALEMELPAGRYAAVVYAYGRRDAGNYTLRSRFEPAAVAPPPLDERPPVPRGQAWGIFVGVADYPGRRSDLDFCAKDARDVQLFFGRSGLGGIPSENMRLLTDRQATKAGIENALRWVQQRAEKDDVVVFFYSGHGGQSDRDEPPRDELDGRDEYLIPYDTNDSHWRNDIRDDELAAWLEDLKTDNVILILDACNSGGFDELVDRPGRAAFLSSPEDKTSEEYHAAQQGLFTYAVLQGLREKKADANRDGRVSAAELNAYLAQNVLLYRRDQRAVVKVNLSGPLYLVY